MMKEHELFAGGHRLAATTWGDVGNGQPTIVMMHGGLDCITTWKDLPQALAEASGWPVLAYDRFGYGRSERLVGGREPSYRREEAGPVLGEVLRHFGIRQALMFGHSDGGAMSLLAAAAHPGLVCGVLACSPTIALDQFMVDAMSGARRAFEHEGLRDKLKRHHGDNTDTMFWGWYEPWASPSALQWDMSNVGGKVQIQVDTNGKANGTGFESSWFMTLENLTVNANNEVLANSATISATAAGLSGKLTVDTLVQQMVADSQFKLL